MMLTNNDAEFQAIDNIDIKKSFIYIGNSLSKTKKCMLLYKESFITRNLFEAKERLLDTNLEIQGELSPALLF